LSFDGCPIIDKFHQSPVSTKSEFLVPFVARATLAHVLPKCIYGQQWQHENPAYPMPCEFFAHVISGEALVSVSGHIYGCTKGEAMMMTRIRNYSFDDPLLNDVALVFLYMLQ
jgi:hypothetical protein